MPHLASFFFDWDPVKAEANQGKHRVSFSEAMLVFRDPLALSVFDVDDSAVEERWITLGAGASGSLLLVVHTWEELDEHRVAIRIISARRPTRKEARQYRDGP